MPQEISRPVLTPIQLRPEHGAEVPDADLHGVGCGALGLAGDVVGRPGQHDGGGGVDAGGGEDGAEVGHARGGGAQQDDVPHDGDAGGAHDEGRAQAVALREDGDRDGQAGGARVGGHGQQLRLGGRVAELLDDGGQEEGERVQWEG